jgi:hypothetical protein
MSDLAFGTSSAATVTVSFWVRSSLTGTFSGTLVNSNDSQVYPFSYTISSASTWEQKTITIAGSTTGTWNSTNGQGLRLQFSLGLGTTYLGTLTNTWNAGTLYGPTGQVNLVATNGATFYVTGVQLEKGNQATPFDFRDYGRELILCQRYYYQTIPNATNATPTIYAASTNFTVGSIFPHPVTMRASPTITVLGTWATNGTAATAPTIDAPNIQGYLAYVNGNNGTIASTSFRPNSSGYLTVYAEL